MSNVCARSVRYDEADQANIMTLDVTWREFTLGMEARNGFDAVRG